MYERVLANGVRVLSSRWLLLFGIVFCSSEVNADEVSANDLVQVFSQQRASLQTGVIEYRRFEQGGELRSLTPEDLMAKWAAADSLYSESEFRGFASSLLSDPSLFPVPWVDAKLTFTESMWKDVDRRNTFVYDGSDWVGERRRTGFREAIVGKELFPDNVVNEQTFRWLLPPDAIHAELTVGRSEEGFVSFSYMPDSSKLRYEGLVDLGGQVVRQLEISASDGKLIRLMLTKNLVSNGFGIGFPRSTLTASIRDGYVDFLTLVTVKRAEFNVPLDEGEFRVSAEPGMMIRDKRSGTREDVPVERPVEDVKNPPQIDWGRGKPIAQEGGANGVQLYIIVGLNVLAIVVFAFVLWYRRRRSLGSK